MIKIGDFIKTTKPFFRGMIIITIVSFFALIVYGKQASFIALNTYHPFWLNVFFVNFTFMGDGIFALCLTALTLFYFKHKKLGLALLYSFLISGIIAQIIKNLVTSPRPKLFFEAGQYLHFIDGVTLANNSSFPSGHTATAFAIATVLAILVKNKNMQLPLFISAVLVGYSRIYLAQHFLLDVLIGAIIGCTSGVISVYLVLNLKNIKKAFGKIRRDNTNNSAIPSPIQTA